jgi:hypothetical protein
LWLWRIYGDRSESGRAERPAAAPVVFKTAALCALPFIFLAGTMLMAFFFGSGLEISPWYGNALGGSDKIRWVALSQPQSELQYRLFNFWHTRDLISLWILSSPLLALAPLALIELRRRRRAETLFLASGLAGLMFFTLFWNADYGMQSDYDLMAMFGVPAQILAALWWDERLDRGRQLLVVGAAAAATFGCSIVPMLHFP